MSERTHHDGSAGRAYTVDQKAAVLRIKRCAPTAYYEILGLEEVKKTCTDGEIKKAYRKLSLLTHPDKNGYDGADEAFKLVSKAFQVLSDPDKKSKFDQFGGDPDARFNPAAAGAGAGGSPFSGFAGQRGGGFQEEMTPEELRRFVEVDGHVGLEEEQEQAARFRRFFPHVAWEPRYTLCLSSEEVLKQADEYGLAFERARLDSLAPAPFAAVA